MATTETKGLMTYVDKNGNKFLIYPVTKAELVDGLEEAIQAFAAGLNYDDRYYTEAEIDQKLQGLPTAGHKHTKSDITDFPALGTAAAKNVATLRRPVTRITTLVRPAQAVRQTQPTN